MFKETKRIISIIAMCFIVCITIPTSIVNAAEKPESENPTQREVLEYVLESGDQDYLIEYQDLFPSSMVSELCKANSENWEKMIRREEERLANVPMEYHLTSYAGTFDGPSGKETYYNLDMSGVISIMRNNGYDEEEYPYWVRDDGVKMFGKYVMVAASFDIRPRGTILQSSLGEAIVCDTGGFASSNQTQLDIAVTW